MCLCNQASSLCWPPLLPQWPPSRPTRATVTPRQATLLHLLLLRATLLRLPLLLATPLSPRHTASACRCASPPLPQRRCLKQAWASIPDETPPKPTETAIETCPLHCIHQKKKIIGGHWSCWTRPSVPFPPFHLEVTATLLIHSAWSHLSALRE